MASSLSVTLGINQGAMAVKKKKGKVEEKEQVESVSERKDGVENEVNKNQSDTNPDEVKEQTSDEKYNDLNNRFLRLYAEFENFRKRTNKERLDIINNANADLLKDLIPVIIKPISPEFNSPMSVGFGVNTPTFSITYS